MGNCKFQAPNSKSRQIQSPNRFQRHWFSRWNLNLGFWSFAPSAFDRVGHGRHVGRVTQDRHVVLYDGECSLCTFQMRVLTWLDWCHVIRLVPISDPLAAQIAPQLTPEALSEAIHCVALDGRIYRGARCIRFVGLRLPLLVPLALILWFPGVIWVAERLYQWVSRNRHLLSRFFGCQGACTIMPARRREGEEALHRK